MGWFGSGVVAQYCREHLEVASILGNSVGELLDQGTKTRIKRQKYAKGQVTIPLGLRSLIAEVVAQYGTLVRRFMSKPTIGIAEESLAIEAEECWFQATNLGAEHGLRRT